MHVLDCIHRPASGTIAIRIVLEVGLEDRLQHELGGGLDHPIPDGRNAERSLASIRLSGSSPAAPDRAGTSSRPSSSRRPASHASRPYSSICGKAHPVHTRSTRIGAGQPIGVAQNVLTADLVVEHVEAEGRLRLRLAIELPLKAPDLLRCCQAHRQSPSPHHLRKRTRSQGPLLRRHYPASTLIRPCPTPAMAVAFRDVEAATLANDGSPPITRTTFPTCRAHYPGGSSGCACRLLPRSCSLPQMAGGSASALSLSRPAQASLALRPAGSLSRPRRPLSRGSEPGQLPGQAARQLPDLSTIIRVEPSSTDDSRLRGALP